MSERVLVTGGAGFIGSHLVDALLRDGNEVRVLDSLHEQVHGEAAGPVSFSSDAAFVYGDVRDTTLVSDCLVGVDAIVHLAARVGVGQSMYEFSDYLDQNCFGTGSLMEAVVGGGFVRKIVVASSMSLYGEGQYRDLFNVARRGVRTREQLLQKVWE